MQAKAAAEPRPPVPAVAPGPELTTAPWATEGSDDGAPAAAPDGSDDKANAPVVTAKVRLATTERLSVAEAKKMLTEAEQLLRAQRFTEARSLFTPLTKTKSTRGRALVSLAEIAFQEKNYEETIRSAKLAADRGGGARARVLLGDAHFRLNHYQDAATAYAQALQLDPENPSAKSGLALASKRM
jgi:cytochrome c-type biogenesis protein CcmH/NrfG